MRSEHKKIIALAYPCDRLGHALFLAHDRSIFEVGLLADLVWRPRCPGYHFKHVFIPGDPVPIIDMEHYTTSSIYEGTVRVGEAEYTRDFNLGNASLASNTIREIQQHQPQHVPWRCVPCRGVPCKVEGWVEGSTAD